MNSLNPTLRYYLSGPISTGGQSITNLANFKSAAIYLRKMGMNIISPIEINHADKSTWHDYMRGDLTGLLFCNGIIMLPGWPQSKGARIELSVALSLDMPVYYFDNRVKSLIDSELHTVITDMNIELPKDEILICKVPSCQHQALHHNEKGCTFCDCPYTPNHFYPQLNVDPSHTD